MEFYGTVGENACKRVDGAIGESGFQLEKQFLLK